MLKKFLSKITKDQTVYRPKPFANDDTDDGTIVENLDKLRQAVVGHKIVRAEQVNKDVIVAMYEALGKTEREIPYKVFNPYGRNKKHLLIELDNGERVIMANTDDCCAYTELESFLLHPESVDHMILGVETSDQYETWHIYADFGDIMELTVGWSCGNPFYYSYGFGIEVIPVG